ncbi:MAG TPA: hypothetical protein VGL61_06050 [Kofleriaceae bacterium]|jgi:hypothetical protein
MRTSLFAIATVVSACQVQTCDLDLSGLSFGGSDDVCATGSESSPLKSIDVELTPVLLDWFPSGAETDVATGGSAMMSVLLDGTPSSYDATSLDSEVVAIEAQDGSSATLQGITEGDACIEIYDFNALLGGVLVGASNLRSVVVVPAGSASERITDDFSAFAFVAGDLQIGVGYLGGYADSGPRLVDLGATLALYRATQTDWQTLAFPSATAGSYTIAANVGSASGSASFDVVDRSNGAHELVRFDGDLPGFACFAALTSSPAFIVGLEWSFTVDGAVASASDDYTNCVAIPRDGVAHTITALAGGQTIAISATAQ